MPPKFVKIKFAETYMENKRNSILEQHIQKFTDELSQQIETYIEFSIIDFLEFLATKKGMKDFNDFSVCYDILQEYKDYVIKRMEEE